MKNWRKNVGVVKNYLRDVGVASIFSVATISLLVWLAYTIFILRRDPQLAGAYVAVGTLILALVTALLAFFTYLNIKTGYQREKRDRKERLLKEVIDWAVAILDIGRIKELPTDVFTRQLFMEGKKIEIENDLRKEIIKDEMLESMYREAISLAHRALYTSKISLKIKEGTFKEHLANTTILIEQHSKILFLGFANKLKGLEAVGRHRHKLDDSARKLIEASVKLIDI